MEQSNRNKAISLLVEDMLKNEEDIEEYLSKVENDFKLLFSTTNKNSRLTRIYKSSETLLNEASKKTNIPKVQLLDLIIKDSLMGRRNLTEYLNNIEKEIKWLFGK